MNMNSTFTTQTTQTTTQHKRQSRYPSDATKQKISSRLKGRSKTDDTKQKISTSMKRYWGNDANFPADGERHEGTGRGYIETGDIV